MTQPIINAAAYPLFLEWVLSQEVDNPEIMTVPLGRVIADYQDYTAALELAEQDLATFDFKVDPPTYPTLDMGDFKLKKGGIVTAETPAGEVTIDIPEPVATCGQCEHWKPAPGMGEAGHCFNKAAPWVRAIVTKATRACDLFE